MEENRKKPNRSPGRRRRMADMKASAISVMAFFAFVVVLAVLLLVLPRPKISEIEKRPLAEMPAFSFADYFAGTFTSGIMTFYDDTVPARDVFKNTGNNIKAAFGIRPKDQAVFVGIAVKKEKESTDAETETAQEADLSETAQAVTEPETEEDIHSRDYAQEVADATLEDGILIVFLDGHWRAVSLCGEVNGSGYAEVVNEMHSQLGKDVQLYVMPIPVSSQYYLPSNYSEYYYDQSESFQNMFSQIDEGVTCLDITQTLQNHNEEPIYLRTDHHWAPLGAYYAARDLTKAAGVPFADLDTDYDKVELDGYVGSMYAFTESANILNDPEQFVFYMGKNAYVTDYHDENFEYLESGDLFLKMEVSAAYTSFLGRDNIIARIRTDVKNGRKLLVVKDSYGNAMIPFFTGSFEEVYVVDQRYFKLNLINFIRYTGVTDVLLTHNIFCLAGPEVELLEDVVHNYTDVPIVDTAPEPDLSKKHVNTIEN